MAVTVWTPASERRPQDQTSHSAIIVLEDIHSREGIGETKAISLVDTQTIAKLEAFFPNYQKYPSSNRAAGWEAGYRVYFNFGKERAIRVTVLQNGNGDTWSIGDGDFATQGNFPEFVKDLQRRAAL